jgi:hypothetical protein
VRPSVQVWWSLGDEVSIRVPTPPPRDVARTANVRQIDCVRVWPPGTDAPRSFFPPLALSISLRSRATAVRAVRKLARRLRVNAAMADQAGCRGPVCGNSLT